jgi:hypothetical protein
MPPKFVVFDSIADRIEHLPGLALDTLSLIPVNDVRTELRWLRRWLDLPTRPPVVPDVDDEAWGEFIDGLLPCLPPGGIGTASASGPELSGVSRDALATQVHRALSALKHAEHVLDAEGSATGLLLPSTFPRRIEHVLGAAELPLAWVRRIDVTRF